MNGVPVGYRWDSKTQKLFVKNKNYQRNATHNIFIISMIGVVNGEAELACLGL